ncbi:MAG TPA: lipoate--protein ligase family protein [Candidatus Salinicoccus merdavium]|nr:lipoate--protein ligase family protein [Candidatus Salinicoccus merdavium]
MNKLFNEQWDYIPASETTHPYHSFAIDDVLQEIAGEEQSLKFRAWVHDPFVILGLHDARLPHLEEGLSYLSSIGYDYIVRNSGGLGVVLDDGILNISLIMEKDKAPLIDEGYDLMLDLVDAALEGADVKAYEIHGSYCPGSYDLSIAGKKFAGVSQRRIKKGVAIQIYLSVSGSGAGRAEIMKEFYRHAKKDAETKFEYPLVQPEVMASLNELLDKNWTVEDVLNKFLGVLGINPEVTYNLPAEYADKYDQYIQRMIKRNEKVRGNKDREIFSHNSQ